MKKISHSLRERFIKDCKIPISLVQDPYFDYYLETYESFYKSKTQYAVFCDLVERLGGEESFFKESKRITDSVIEAISSTEAYAYFSNMSLQEYSSNKSDIKQQNIYNQQNVGQAFASFDLSKANYNALKFINPEIVLNTNSYEDLMKLYTQEEYFINSKHIRQVIFGHLNPTRQLRIQSYIIQKRVIPEILKFMPDTERIISASEDEVVIKMLPFESITENYINGLKNFKSGVPVKYTAFVLRQLGNKPYFFKEFGYKCKPPVEFKAVPQNYFAECFKYYLKEEPSDFDMCAYHEGRVVKYLDPLFSNSGEVSDECF